MTRDDPLKDVLAHLVAAVSLLERGGRKAAPSDTMFAQMLKDYNASIERGRAAIVAERGSFEDGVKAAREAVRAVDRSYQSDHTDERIWRQYRSDAARENEVALQALIDPPAPALTSD